LKVIGDSPTEDITFTASVVTNVAERSTLYKTLSNSDWRLAVFTDQTHVGSALEKAREKFARLRPANTACG